jgi:hypothetical protein
MREDKKAAQRAAQEQQADEVDEARREVRT